MNILIVNFNIIMHDYINLYHTYNKGAKDIDFWESKANQKKIDDLINYDANLLREISRLITTKVKQGSKFQKTYSYKDILKDIEKNESKIGNVYNIDFFNRLSTEYEELEKLLNFNKYTEFNYIEHILNKYAEEGFSYVWFKSLHSTVKALMNCENNKIASVNDLSMIYKNNVDKIYFLYSEEDVPYKYKHLFEIISEVVEIAGGSTNEHNDEC